MKMNIRKTNDGNHITSPLPPHKRNQILTLVPDENDFKDMAQIFEDPDTTSAVWTIIESAPPEIKVLFFLQLQTWQETHSLTEEREVF
ncbi:hypothetical protein [Fusibacter sp. 3D3]|uniref:hypothetical protein n=1 Tax=Fusibacter sp. 3D3 TaxID=1048380 RepID=UPI000853A562|nr:hypothetical protein [Fusibacter sp. 3D3]GAU75613.1 hypothetical protein F3D3_0204 [Fusibacter sp. 3D3]